MGSRRRHELVICAILRDEAPYLREWIAFHRLVGVDHFYLYDNGSRDGTAELLRHYARRGIVTARLIRGRGVQLDAYAHWLAHERRATRWVAFLDGDEFLYPTREESLPAVLEDFRAHPGVQVAWRVFGTSGHLLRPRAPTIAAFTACKRPRQGELCKTIAQAREIVAFNNPHALRYRRGRRAVATDGTAIVPGPENRGGARIAPHYGRLCVNHYVTRSLEDCFAKIARGRATLSVRRPRRFCLEMDHGEERNEAILRWEAALRERLQVASERDRCALAPPWNDRAARFDALQERLRAQWRSLPGANAEATRAGRSR